MRARPCPAAGGGRGCFRQAHARVRMHAHTRTHALTLAHSARTHARTGARTHAHARTRMRPGGPALDSLLRRFRAGPDSAWAGPGPPIMPARRHGGPQPKPAGEARLLPRALRRLPQLGLSC